MRRVSVVIILVSIFIQECLAMNIVFSNVGLTDNPIHSFETTGLYLVEWTDSAPSYNSYQKGVYEYYANGNIKSYKNYHWTTLISTQNFTYSASDDTAWVQYGDTAYSKQIQMFVENTTKDSLYHYVKDSINDTFDLCNLYLFDSTRLIQAETGFSSTKTVKYIDSIGQCIKSEQFVLDSNNNKWTLHPNNGHKINYTYLPAGNLYSQTEWRWDELDSAYFLYKTTQYFSKTESTDENNRIVYRSQYEMIAYGATCEKEVISFDPKTMIGTVTVSTGKYGSTFQLKEKFTYQFADTIQEVSINTANISTDNNSFISVQNNSIHFSNNQTPYSIQLFSANGRLIKEINGTKQVVSFHDLGLAHGIYQMRVEQGSKSTALQFILR